MSGGLKNNKAWNQQQQKHLHSMTRALLIIIYSNLIFLTCSFEIRHWKQKVISARNIQWGWVSQGSFEYWSSRPRCLLPVNENRLISTKLPFFAEVSDFVARRTRMLSTMAAILSLKAYSHTARRRTVSYGVVRQKPYEYAYTDNRLWCQVIAIINYNRIT